LGGRGREIPSFRPTWAQSKTLSYKKKRERERETERGREGRREGAREERRKGGREGVREEGRKEGGEREGEREEKERERERERRKEENFIYLGPFGLKRLASHTHHPQCKTTMRPVVHCSPMLSPNCGTERG
jgi:hypothetical protein